MRGTGFGWPERSSAVPGVVDVNAIERGCEAVRVALAPDLAVGDDVEPSLLLCPDREHGRVVLRLLEPRLGNSPKLLGAHARRKSTGEFAAIDQPFGLWVTTDQRSGKQHEPSPFANLESSGCPALSQDISTIWKLLRSWRKLRKLQV